MRIGVAAPRRRRCGVADFARRLGDELGASHHVRWIWYPQEASARLWRRAARSATGLDVVHLHFEAGLFHPLKPYRNRFVTLVRGLRSPVVVTLHGPLPVLEPRWCAGRRSAPDLLRDLAYLPFFTGWERRLLQGVDHWIVHNRDLLERVRTMAGAGRVSYMPHPVPPTRRRWRLEPGGVPVLVTPGFVKPHKGHRDLVRALAGTDGWSWVLAGGTQEPADLAHLDRLREEAAGLGLADRVRVTGYLDREEMETTLAGATLAVFPYREVVGSGAVAWAIGCGVPVVTTDLSEFRALRADGAGIDLLPAGDPEQWRGLLHRLVPDAARLEELAERNRSWAAANGFDAAARLHLRIFERSALREAP